ncbi:hypothetical protein GH5_07890 [Leishmania sp. Ghana 2012 LV757]|uniref:hypothetical protein n=1 Tax=Leishmania sp. Ghana 2012 LV757 TaxID=2803181 RepID=UPI001B5266A7|nr:hypothetical protein GH5_07890 [Leishmania sp. Ghana 2012 LV757]
MYNSPSPSKQRSRCSPGKLRGKAKQAEQARHLGEKESAQSTRSARTGSGRRGGRDAYGSAPPSSTPQAPALAHETRVHESSSHCVTRSGSGFSYLRATTAAPESTPSPAFPASANTGQVSKTATWSQAPIPTSSLKESHKDTNTWPSAHAPLSSPLHSSTPAESSLARLRALAGLAPLRTPSSDPLAPTPYLHRNEESPPRHSRKGRADLGGSRASSLSSSCASSPYTPELARRLSSLNGTSAQATLAVLERDRIKLVRSDNQAPPSPSTAPFYQNEEEVSLGQQCRGAPTVSVTATPAVGNPFLAPSLGLADPCASASALYQNEEDTVEVHCVGTESGSAQSTASLLSRLRAASPCLASAAEGGGNQSLYIPSKGGVAGLGPALGGASAPHEPTAGSPWKSVATLLGPTHLAESPPSPGPGLPHPSGISARLAQLRQRASTPPKSLSSIAKAEASVASCTESAQAPQPSSFMNLSRLRRLANVQRREEQPSVPWRRTRLSGNHEVVSPSPAAALDAALERTPQHRVLVMATAAPTPPAAIDSVDTNLGSVEAQSRDTHCQQFEGTSTSSASLVKQSTGHAAAKASKRRAPTRKRTVSTTAKKESAVAAVAVTSRLSKGPRSHVPHAGTVTLLASPSVMVDAAAGEGAMTCTSSSVHAKQLMHKLRSLAAPVPVGEIDGKKNPATVPDPFLVSAATPLGHSPRKQLSQYPSSLPPNKPETVPLKTKVSTLPPSWSTTSPFAALASPSLHAALTQASAELFTTRRSRGTKKGTDGVRDEEGHQIEPPSSSFSSVPPYYTYPSMMTRSATAAAAAALAAASKTISPVNTVSTTSTTGTTDLSSWAHMRTTNASSRKSGNAKSEMKCFVFDTSSLLDSEPGVMNLVLEKWLLAIPFTVLDELDRMHKDRGGGGGKSDHAAAGANGMHDREWRRQRAHELRNWIAACLTDESKSRLLLQKRTEVVEEYDRHATSNDDRILGYAVYLSQHQAAKVLFVSEDKFLRIKASSELGKAYAYSEVRRLVGMPPLPAASPMALQEKGNK